MSGTVRELKRETEESAENLLEIKLPNALPDMRSDEKAWQELQAILVPPATKINIDEDLLCPIGKCLMRDPVVAFDGQTYEREAIVEWLVGHDTSPLTGAPLKHTDLIENVFARKVIDGFITQHPALKDSEEWYLPRAWVRELREACLNESVPEIKAWGAKDHRLVVHVIKEGEYTGQRMLHVAVLHHKSLDAVVALLEQRKKGLALATLLTGDASGQWPLECALRSGAPAAILMKLMGWMGNALTSFKLTAPLPPVSQKPLRDALHWCITEEDLIKIPLLLAWGATPGFPRDRFLPGILKKIEAQRIEAERRETQISTDRRAESNSLNSLIDNLNLIPYSIADDEDEKKDTITLGLSFERAEENDTPYAGGGLFHGAVRRTSFRAPNNHNMSCSSHHFFDITTIPARVDFMALNRESRASERFFNQTIEALSPEPYGLTAKYLRDNLRYPDHSFTHYHYVLLVYLVKGFDPEDHPLEKSRDLRPEERLTPKQAIEELNDLCGIMRITLKSLYASGLRGSHLRNFQPASKFDFEHYRALEYFIKDREPALTAEAAMDRINGLTGTDVIAVVDADKAFLNENSNSKTFSP